MNTDPYRTEPERPMSEITRDKLLLHTAALSSFAAAMAASKYPELERDVIPLMKELKELLVTAKKEMGIK